MSNLLPWSTFTKKMPTANKSTNQTRRRIPKRCLYLLSRVKYFGWVDVALHLAPTEAVRPLDRQLGPGPRNEQTERYFEISMKTAVIFVCFLHSLVPHTYSTTYTIDWLNVTTATRTVQNIDLGLCVCDLTFFRCDVNCLCDTDCTKTDELQFAFALPDGPQSTAVEVFHRIWFYLFQLCCSDLL